MLIITKNLSKTSLWLASVKTSQQFIIAQPLFRWRQSMHQSALQISHSSEFLHELFCILEHSSHGLFHRISLLFLLHGLEPSLFPYPQRGCSVWQLITQNEVLFPLHVFCPTTHKRWQNPGKLSPVNTKRRNPPKLLALFSSISCLDMV